MLQDTENRIINLAERIYDKTLIDEALKRNDEIIVCLGHIYRQAISTNYLGGK